MSEKKSELEVRELAEKFFEEEISKLDDPQRKEEVELEKETYIGVWMLGYRAGESPAEQPVAYNELERHETRLALRLLLKVFKNDQISKEQEKFCSQAEAILKKYSKGKVIMRAKPSPWVPADTKPEHNVGVLVFIPGEDNHITSGMWDVENKWVLLDEYRTPEEEVTHWMPLPALPEGYKRDDKITDEWVRELKAIAKEELSKKDEQPVREVEFAEWISEQGYWPVSKDQWMKSHFENNKTTAELYDLFKQKPGSGEKEVKS